MVDSFIPQIRFKMCKNQWEKNKLSKLAKFNPKSTLPEKFKYVDLESVLGTDLISYREVSRENAPSRAQRLAQKGDIFYQTVRPYQKNNYLFDSNEKDYVFSTGYAQLRPLIDSAFLLARLQEESFVNMVLERCTGTSYPAINSKDLSKISVTIPQTIEEQSGIGSLFRTLDDLLTSYKENLVNYQSLKATMLSKMFPKVGQTVPEIRLDGFEEEWRKCYLGSIFEQVSNYIEPSVDNELWSLTVEKGLTPKTDRYKRDFLVKKNDKFKKVDINEFVYNPMNLTLGALDLNNKGRTISVSGYYIVINNTDVEKFDNDFLKILLKTRYAIYQYKQFATGTLIEKQRVQFPTFSEIPFYLPPIDEQQVIGAYFSKLDQLITSYQEKITQLETLKKKLLQDMFI